MAQFPPIENHCYKNGDVTYKVTSVEGNNINCVVVDQNGNPIGSPQIIKRKNWEKGDYIDMSGNSPSQDNASRHANASMFSFSYEPDTGEIVVTYPDGIRTERLKGLKGKDGASVFEEWCRRKGIMNPTQADWENFMRSLRQVVNGQDAPSPYEEWLGRQNKDASPEEKSYTAFIRSITGEKGKDGYEGRDGKDGLSAFEVWKSIQPNGDSLTEKDFFDFLKGDTGKNGHEGVDGKNGDTWKPYLSEDGILYFENTTTGERTKPVNLKGLQGPSADKGENGDTWEPYFPDDGKHQLYFKNNRGEVLGPFDVLGATGAEGKQGPRGESAYQIWLNEGHKGDFHDFLLWIAEQAQKGEDGEDGDTFRPHVEKGHLFFISTKTGERIDGGCVVGPKGETGETGLSGHNITHKYGYKEIYDWTCPVQEINPHLLSSSDDLASGGSAEEHMRETLNRINNIRKQGEKKENRGGKLQEFFWWCSGADTRLLRMCPAEHSKYMGIGTVIFFTALMAMFSSYIAISFVFGQEGNTWIGCVAFAIAWGAMIFCLDRFITNTMYSDGKVTISWLELRSALPRILISIFLGIVISAPLELKIFEKEINAQILLEKERFVNNNVKSTEEEINRLSEINDSIRVKIDERKDNLSNNITVESRLDKENERFAKEENQINKRYTYPRMPGTTREKDPDGWLAYDERCREIDNKRSRDLAKAQMRHDSICNFLNSQSNENISTAGFENLLSSNDRTIQHNRQLLTNKRDSLSRVFDRSDGLGRRLAALHAIAYQEDKEEGYKPWPWVKDWWGIVALGIFILLVIVSSPFLKNVVKGDEDEDGNFAKIHNPRLKGMAVLYPWFAVTALICGYFANTLFNALPYYIFTAVGMIMMLFILIDVSPVFYKMMLADGQYEQYLHKEKSITQDLVRLNFAKSIAKVNESEIGRLAPLIFSRPFKKIKKILSKADNVQKEELGWIVRDRNGDIIETAYESIRIENRNVFDTVLGMKKAIIEASYQAWYRDMRDAIIGMHNPKEEGGDNPNTRQEYDYHNPDLNDAENSARRETGNHTSDDEPFDTDNYYGRNTGTSPDYVASPDDEHPGTPEDILNGYYAGTQASNLDLEDLDDDISEEPDIDIESHDEDVDVESDYENPDSDDSSKSDPSNNPDANVESEVEDYEEDDTINPI